MTLHQVNALMKCLDRIEEYQTVIKTITKLITETDERIERLENKVFEQQITIVELKKNIEQDQAE